MFDLPYGTGVPGYTNYGTQFLRITNDNPSNSLKAVAAHEFFHLWQYAHLNYFTKEKHDWWLEATARWAEEYVFPDLDLYIDDVQQYALSLPILGFKEIASRKQERYAAASLAFYLESYSPGFIARTFDSESGLNFRSEPWYTTFGRLLGGDFSDEFNDYVVTYFYRWRFDSKVPDIKEWFPTGGGYIDNDLTRPIPNVAKKLVTATVKLSPETPSDLVRDAGGSSLGFLPPLSGQLIKVSIDGNVKNAHLVFRQSGSEADGLLRVTIFPGPNEKTGIVLDPDDGRQLLIENIVENGMNQVYVVVSNSFVTRNSYLGALYLDLEVYLLQPPEGLNIAEVGDGRLSLTWKASPLSQGDMPEDNGALRRYRIYRQNTGQEPLAAVDASMTSWEFTHCNLESDSLTVRAVDKYGNESPDSNPIVVPPAQGCDSEEPVPEAPEGEPTEVGAVPLPTPAEEWAIYEASTDFSAMGLFVNDVGTVAERKACSLRGGGLCTDTSPTLSEINLDMVLGPFPSREEAIQGFCDNIVPDSAYSVRGFRKAKLLFDGEDHYIFNGPVC